MATEREMAAFVAQAFSPIVQYEIRSERNSRVNRKGSRAAIWNTSDRGGQHGDLNVFKRYRILSNAAEE